MITDINIPELTPYRIRNEVQLLRYNEPREGIFICESGKVIRRALDAGYEPISFVIASRHLRSGAFPFPEYEKLSAPVYTAEDEVLSALAGYKLTGGMLCAMQRKPLPDAASLCMGKRRIAVLEDIENPTNIGAIFRSAAALGMEAVLLTEDCADPFYRRAARVSMGTVFQIPWSRIGKKTLTTFLHAQGFSIASMALKDTSVGIDDPELKKEQKLAVVLGNEEQGLSEETIEESDYVVKIPMSAGVDSLNVAAAGAVVFWELSSEKRADRR